METMRVLFRKTGRARYLSHLDLNRCMQRAIRRAGIPVWYTQGFNPHPYITFVLPLPLGCESVCECMDIRLSEDAAESFGELAGRLSRQLPEGIEVIGAVSPEMKIGDLGYARYRLEYEFENVPEEELKSSFDQLLAQPQVTVTKETKRSETQIDVLPMLKKAEVQVEQNRLSMEVTLPAGDNGSVSLTCMENAVEQCGLIPILCHSRRLQLFNRDMKPFR